MAAIRDGGEGTAAEIATAVSSTRLWLVLTCIAIGATVLAALVPVSRHEQDNG